MTKILIAVKSCAKDAVAGCHDQIRKSWGKHINGRADLIFFIGKVALPLNGIDEVQVDAPDGYNFLALKVNAILRWAIAREYDFVVLVDTDTFIVPDRLFALKFDFDYGGFQLPWGPFMFGGCGFVLSRLAAQLVVELPIQHPLDDRSIGVLLKDAPIHVASLHWNRFIGWHFPKNTYGLRHDLLNWQGMMAERYLGALKMPRIAKVVIGGAPRDVQIELCAEDRTEDM